jgi:hypothetical protein
MVLTNAALVLMFLIGLGAALLCWQKKRTGHSCWFFTEINTLEKFHIAETSLTHTAAHLA